MIERVFPLIIILIEEEELKKAYLRVQNGSTTWIMMGFCLILMKASYSALI